MIRALFMLFIFFAFPVHAQAQDIVLKSDICYSDYIYTPSDDVTYQPDPDVVPADLNESKIRVPAFIEYPLTLDLAKYLNNPTISENLVQEAQLGMIRVYTDGHVTYNGEDITTDVKEFCKQEESQDEPASSAE